MAQHCSVCVHNRRPEIESQLLGGTTLRQIAEKFHLSQTALHRHKKSHVSASLVKARSAATISHADSLVDKLTVIEGLARELATNGKSDRDRIAALREWTRMVEMLAKLRGELAAGATVNVGVIANADWPALRSRILLALEPFPEARAAVAKALEGSN